MCLPMAGPLICRYTLLPKVKWLRVNAKSHSLMARHGVLVLVMMFLMV